MILYLPIYYIKPLLQRKPTYPQMLLWPKDLLFGILNIGNLAKIVSIKF